MMNDKELKKYLRNLDRIESIDIDTSFMYAKICSEVLADKEHLDFKVAEKIVIHILNKWNTLPFETKPIWSDIAESVGFYPYINRDKEMKSNSLSDEMRLNFHKSKYIPGIYMHSKQKELSEIIFAGQNLVVSASTSFGKSLLIEEIVASGNYHNIVVIQPTLALLDETRRKMRKYSDKYKIIVRTSQRPSEKKGNLFLLTAERVVEYLELPKINFLIIDEFYKLSGSRRDDRVDALNNAFVKIWYKFHPQFYLLGPNIHDVSKKFLQKFNALFYRSDYSMVDSSYVNMIEGLNLSKKKRKNEQERKEILFKLLYNMAEGNQTLVYCSSPRRARLLAKEYTQYIKDRKENIRSLPICDWLQQNIPRWSLCECLSYGVGIHDGSLQKHIGSSIIGYFNNHKIDVIFCTSTIIEGVNTSAKNVVVFDDKKGRDVQRKDIYLDYFDYSNIKGRAGRLMEHYLGTVYSFIQTPKYEEVVIDIPFCDQKPVTPEILINIPSDDVIPENKMTYEKYQKLEPELLQILKQNGISLKKQLKLYEALIDEIKKSPQTFQWKNFPTYDNLLKLVTIAENCELWRYDNAVHSSKQLTLLIMNYEKNHDIYSIAKGIYKYKVSLEKNFDQKIWDDSVQQAFHIHRQWFQYSVPKIIRVMDGIQRYICKSLNIDSGSYSCFVQKLESDFLHDNLTILIEYGLPASTIRKIDSTIPTNIDDEAVLDYVRNNKDSFKQLMQYELELLNNF